MPYGVNFFTFRLRRLTKQLNQILLDEQDLEPTVLDSTTRVLN
ncbi:MULTISPECIES: hypothetical protein [unclassified Moraxella]